MDALAVANSLASLAPQLPPEDEVFFLDVGATGNPAWLEPFGRHEWTTYSACQARHPEQQSYTFGLNSAMAGLKVPLLFVWRTDYVYQAVHLGRLWNEQYLLAAWLLGGGARLRPLIPGHWIAGQIAKEGLGAWAPETPVGFQDALRAQPDSSAWWMEIS